MTYILEVFLAIIITYIFIKKESPKLKFLFYGYFFFIINLFIQIPFRFLDYFLNIYFNNEILIPFILITILTIIVSQISKYISLGRFLKTRSYKNGILFGIGWTTLESLNFISSYFFKIVFSFFGIEYNISNILQINSFLNFTFFFILNIAITVLIIIAIIKRKKMYILYAILFIIISYFGLLVFSSLYKLIFIGFLLIYCFFIIFHYRRLK